MAKIVTSTGEYEWDNSRLMASEAMSIKTYTGKTVKEWNEGIAAFDTEALLALVWLARTRAGETVKFRDVDFDLASFRIVGDDGEDTEEPEGGEADPPEAAQ